MEIKTEDKWKLFQHEPRFATTKYLLNLEFADLLGLQEPVTKLEVERAFITYTINHELIDLRSHTWSIFKCPKLKQMLGVDITNNKAVFKQLTKMMAPIKRMLTEIDVARVKVRCKQILTQ